MSKRIYLTEDFKELIENNCIYVDYRTPLYLKFF